jgi:Rieske Fe-S protein
LSDPGHDTPHLPGPSLWPIGFAIGVACLLLGLVISWVVAAIGAVLAVGFGLLWARDVTRDVRGEVPEIEPETRTVADTGAPVMAAAEPPLPAFPRSKFLEFSLIGLAGTLGGVLTLPVLGFMVLPAFTDIDEEEIDLGPVDNFPEGQYVIANYLAHPGDGQVSRRTVFVRNNGQAESGEPSYTILYSRCVHLGCPTQPNGPIDEEAATELPNGALLRPVLAQSFGCPCHGGQYDAEGNRTAGPPVRSMDRFTFSIRDGNLILGELYAVGKVSGTGASARIKKYPWSTPGTHVDGLESWLYPIVPEQVTG